jgi:tryptophan 2,3-dioxygenase
MRVAYYEILEKKQKYKDVETLSKILELIAICEARRKNHILLCESLYGKNMGTQKDRDYVDRQNKVILRLRRYYNYRIDTLERYA